MEYHSCATLWSGIRGKGVKVESEVSARGRRGDKRTVWNKEWSKLYGVGGMEWWESGRGSECGYRGSFLRTERRQQLTWESFRVVGFAVLVILLLSSFFFFLWEGEERGRKAGKDR